MKNKFKDKLRFEFTSKRFWIINFSFLIFWLVLFLLVSFLGYKNVPNNSKYLDAFSVSSFITFLIVLLILVFKWGFLRHTINKTRDSLDTNKKMRQEAKLKKMTETEKKVYLKMQAEKEAQRENKLNKVYTNFPYYFALLFWFVLTLPVIAIIINAIN
ncbi:hypothetical protein [Mycoplasma buteonis]|uniref:hypothetical protein n=1 Tax=Mycoplasma buteonis TaxID=171280 RepID=UPI00055B72BC|nr:hypothetical protein [Mycoplasma buteonis]